MVGFFFLQALRQGAVDARVEFDIPRPRPRPREPVPAPAPAPEPVQQMVNVFFGRLLRMIQ